MGPVEDRVTDGISMAPTLSQGKEEEFSLGTMTNTTLRLLRITCRVAMNNLSPNKTLLSLKRVPKINTII